MQQKFYLVAVAGGQGVRMGASMPKQFLEIGGKPILRRTIEAFVKVFPEVHVITVLPEACFSYWKNYCMEHDFNVPQTLVPGGLTRYHSVLAALDKIPDGAIVAIHDGVRPLVSEDLLRRMMDKMNFCRALIPVLPSVDTLTVLRCGENGELQDVEGRRVERSEIFCVQTPQIFHSEDIKAAYSGAFDPSFTDDASVARKKNIPLSYIEGERLNIKITTSADLEFAQMVLASKRLF